jgi:hypothetical protein
MQNQEVIVIDSSSSGDEEESELERFNVPGDAAARVPTLGAIWHMPGAAAQIAPLNAYDAYHNANAATTNTATTIAAAAAATSATTAAANKEDNYELDVPAHMAYLHCPISHALMRNPVMCADGHSYGEANIKRWLANNDKSPLTNKMLEHKNSPPTII